MFLLELAGGGLGGFIFPWLINVVLETKGFPWLCRIWALLTAVVFSVSIVFIKPRAPLGKPARGRAPWFPAGGWSFAKNPLFLLSVRRRPPNLLPARPLLFGSPHPRARDPRVHTFILCSQMLCAAFGGLAYLPVANYLAVYAHSFSSSTTTVNLVVGLFNLAASVGCFIAGALCDRSYALANALSGALCALVSLTAWGLADTLGKVYLFAVLFGLVGQQSATWGAATRNLAGASGPSPSFRRPRASSRTDLRKLDLARSGQPAPRHAHNYAHLGHEGRHVALHACRERRTVQPLGRRERVRPRPLVLPFSARLALF